MKQRIIDILRWSEKYTKTDMVFLASGHFWFFVGRGIAMASGFILTVGFANLLTPTEYGTYKYILAGAGIIGAFTLGGLAAAVQRALARGYSNVIRPMVRYALWWNTPAVIIAISVAGYYLMKGDSQLGIAFLFVAFSMAFTGYGITKILFAPTGEFKMATYFGTLRTLIPVFLLITVLFFTKNVLLIVLTYFVTQVGMNLITYYWSLRYIQPKTSDEFVRETKRYSVLTTGLTVVQSSVRYIDQFLLWHFLGPVALATYTIAMGPTNELRTLADNVAQVALPKFARKGARAHVDSGTVPRRTKQFFLILCIVVFLYILAAPLLFKVFFPQYLGSVFYSQLLALIILLQPRNLADTFLFAYTEVRDRFAIYFPTSVVRLLLFIALIPFFGIMGAIAAIFISELVHTSLVFFQYYWKFERKS